MSKIEEIIGEIELYLDSCKPQAFTGNKKVVVEKDVMDEMLAELRMRTPEEIKKYQKIISNQDAILADAEEKAEAIIAEARVQQEELVSEASVVVAANQTAREIIEQANSQAQHIVDNAVNEANALREGAMDYATDQLKNLQTILAHCIEDSSARFAGFLNEVQDAYDIVTANRAELEATELPMQETADIDTSMSSGAPMYDMSEE